MTKVKHFLSLLACTLFIVSLVLSYRSWQDYTSIHNANEYTDEGVHTFRPFEVFVRQVKNTSSDPKERSRNPKINIYFVHYKTNDGSGYEYKLEIGRVRTTAEQKMREGNIECRVLSIPKNNTYIVTEPQYTIKEYVSKSRKKYITIMVLSVLYSISFIVFIIFKKIRSTNNTQ